MHKILRQTFPPSLKGINSILCATADLSCDNKDERVVNIINTLIYNLIVIN